MLSGWRKHFSGGALAVREARHAVRERLSGELPPQRLDDVELLISELATNSVRHCDADSGRISMEADVSARCVRMRVCDEGHGFAEPDEPSPRADGSGGYGLVLLDRLADRWGTNHNGSFCVWFEVERGASG
jgi:anti-sigma regulatory factor (Ser/Thr protein kinase)